MNARTIVQFFLSVALAVSCSLAVADPASCDPAVATPPNEETTSGSWFQQIFTSPGKPQPFQGVITEGPVEECSLTGDSRPVASDSRYRDHDRVLN